jgi:hypothetical protein
MKRLTFLAVVMMATSGVGTALAEPTETPAISGAVPSCLNILDIKRSRAVDARTILFYMRDGNVWKNSLQGLCPGLTFNGFAYRTNESQICADSQAIRVLVSKETCTLGKFTAYTPAPGSPG